MKFKKITSLILSSSILFSSVSIVIGKKIILSNDKNKYENAETSGNLPEMKKTNTVPKNEEKVVIDNKSYSESVIGEEVEYKFADGTPVNKDIFNFNQVDLEDLIKQGYTVNEILEADRIGNEIVYEPKKLLKRSKEENTSIEKLRETIILERTEKVINDFAKANAYDYELISQSITDKKEMQKLIEIIKLYKITDCKKFLNDYKTNGDKCFENWKNLSSEKETPVSNEEKIQFNQQLSESEISQLEKISKNSGQPIEQLKEKFIKTRSKYERRK